MLLFFIKNKVKTHPQSQQLIILAISTIADNMTALDNSDTHMQIIFELTQMMMVYCFSSDVILKKQMHNLPNHFMGLLKII